MVRKGNAKYEWSTGNYLEVRDMSNKPWTRAKSLDNWVKCGTLAISAGHQRIVQDMSTRECRARDRIAGHERKVRSWRLKCGTCARSAGTSVKCETQHEVRDTSANWETRARSPGTSVKCERKVWITSAKCGLRLPQKVLATTAVFFSLVSHKDLYTTA